MWGNLLKAPRILDIKFYSKQHRSDVTINEHEKLFVEQLQINQFYINVSTANTQYAPVHAMVESDRDSKKEWKDISLMELQLPLI